MKKTVDSKSRFVPTPQTYFILTVVLFLLGCGMTSTTFVLRKRVDHDGQIMLSPDGNPIFYIDSWASYWNGWLSNIPVTLAFGFLALGIVMLLRGMPYNDHLSSYKKRFNKPHMATPRKPSE